MWSHSVVSDALWHRGLQPTRLLCPWGFPGKNTGVGCHSLLQGIFPTQELNPALLHSRQILSCLSHQGSWDVSTEEGCWAVLQITGGSFSKAQRLPLLQAPGSERTFLPDPGACAPGAVWLVSNSARESGDTSYWGDHHRKRQPSPLNLERIAIL